jgi:hypothetical protein
MNPSPDPAPVMVRTPRPRLDDDTLRALRRAASAAADAPSA